MTEWMDQLTQAATRLVAERHRDIAFLRSTAAAGVTDPVVRARLEREAAEAAATADGYAARAAELAVGNEPWEEAEIAQQVEQARVAATHDVLDGPGETTEQLRQREIADATMLSYLTWQQEGVPPQEIAHRLERVSPIGAKAVSDYERLLTIGYEPDEARAIAAGVAAQDPIPVDGTVEDEFGEELFEPDVPDQVLDEVEQLAFDRAYTVGEEAIDLFENVLREAEGEADALAETLRMFDGDSLAVAQAALDLYTAHRGTEDEPPDHAELVATVAAEHAIAQDPDVVVIDPDELMPAGEAMRNYFVAEDAVGRFAQLRAEGWDDDAAAARAVEASLDETGLAAAAVMAYRRQLDAGQSHDAAEAVAVSDAATAFTSRISAEQADQVRAALTHPADGVEHASAHDTGEESTVDSNEPGISAQAAAAAARRRNDEELYQSQVEQRYQALLRDGVDMVTALRLAEEAASELWQVEPWSAVIPRGTRATAETVSESTTVTTFSPGDVVRSRTTGELSTVTDDAATWDPAFYAPADEVAAPEVAEQAPDPGGWIARNLPARDNTASTDVPEMDLRTAIELVAEDSRIESGNEGLTARDATVAARELTEEDVHGVVESDATRAAYLTVINAFDADVDRALAALPTVPSNDGQASAWPVVDQDETAGAVVAADETVARIDQVLTEDADGAVSEEDAEEQYIEQRRASLRAELAAAADGMTVEDARAIVRQADGLEDHLSSCSQDVSQCSTCSQHEHETSDFWTVDVPAARQRLANAPLVDRVAECGRAVEEVEDAVQHHDPADEDTERAERCARWNADDAADERADDDTEGWGQ
ncbi:hypothetical protein ABTX61_21475 [Amycolatopsis japonica]|uniref:hypothetical protein n=1 Tax=Amycolatopsis japonica TaxID=208439 RepID=UPI00332CCBE9